MVTAPAEPTYELRPISSLWWLPVVFGVVALGVGIFFVVSPHETLSTFTAIAGIFLLIDGVIALVGSIFGGGESRGLLALIGVLSAIAGLVLIKKPFDTLVVFAIIVGIWFVVAGIVRFVAAIGEPDRRGANIFVALVDLAIGALILAWPDLGLATFAVLVGIGLILRGLLFAYAGWQLRKLHHAAA
jgi:uncharacterized membrane protein HdeD (DUF308 family)